MSADPHRWHRNSDDPQSPPTTGGIGRSIPLMPTGLSSRMVSDDERSVTDPLPAGDSMESRSSQNLVTERTSSRESSESDRDDSLRYVLTLISFLVQPQCC